MSLVPAFELGVWNAWIFTSCLLLFVPSHIIDSSECAVLPLTHFQATMQASGEDCLGGFICG
jgi:hypothetical protein